MPCAPPVTMHTLSLSFMAASLTPATAPWQARRSAEDRADPFERARHHGGVAFLFDRASEELAVVPPVVARGGERSGDARERDVAVTRDDALVGSERPDLEVTHLHQRDAIAARPDVVVEPPLDPGVVDLEHHPEPGRSDPVDEIERLPEAMQERQVHPQ